jgi:hypothetical protein
MLPTRFDPAGITYSDGCYVVRVVTGIRADDVRVSTVLTTLPMHCAFAMLVA